MGIIRQLTLEDLELYVDHLARHLPEPGVNGIYSQPFPHGAPIDKESFRKIVTARWGRQPGIDRWEIAWGLFKDEKIVGHLEMNGAGIPALNHRAKIGMGIENSYRRQGFGQKLLEAALGWARAQNFLDYIDLDVFAHNKVALNIYKSFGFKHKGQISDRLRVEGQSIDDVQMTLNLRGSFPPGYKFEICDKARFQEVVAELSKSVFGDENICAWLNEILSEKELKKLDKLNANYQSNYTLYTLLFYKERLAGWSYGYQDTRESFFMTNSALLPEFQGKSLYSCMLDEVLKILVDKGFQRIHSQHLLTNNSIILTKLRKGFLITGMQVNDLCGTLLELTFFTNQMRKNITDFRVGQKKPSEEVKRLLKI